MFTLALLEDSMSLGNLLLEVVLVSEQLLVVDSGLIQDHTGDGRGFLLTVSLEDGRIDVVTNEVVTIFATQAIELTNVNLRKSQLSCRLLGSTLHLLLVHLRLILTLGPVLVTLVVVAVATTIIALTATVLASVTTSVIAALIVVMVSTTLVATLVLALLLSAILLLLHLARGRSTHHLLLARHHTGSWLHG